MTTITTDPSFSRRILDWFAKHGRHDLPWQQLNKPTPNPYEVWVSEIMLQQTQVASVIGYYQKFMTRFPTLQALADAPLDEVLENWAGLGYYARARNLHKTAKELQSIIATTRSYPSTLDDWQALSGIGKSTAGAILAMGLGQFGVICDGNVKRVLTRHFGIDGDIAKPATDKHLWQIASDLTPKDNSGHYAQAMMDMGATLCTRTHPNCTHCPIASTCVAYNAGTPTAYPVKAKKAPKPTQNSYALVFRHQDKFLWIQRPADGIWGGLWCLPLLSENLGQNFVEILLIDKFELSFGQFTPNSTIRHTLTHFHWQLSPIVYPLDHQQFKEVNTLLINANAKFEWYNKNNTLAKPVAMQKLMDLLND